MLPTAMALETLKLRARCSPVLENKFYENLTRIPRPVDGDEWFKKLINYRNRGGHSHEFGVMPRLVDGDSQIQAISLHDMDA